MEIKYNHMKDEGQEFKWDLGETPFSLAYNEIFSQVYIIQSSNI